jgi:hypothetical protein
MALLVNIAFRTAALAKELFDLRVRQILTAVNCYVIPNGAQRLPQVNGPGARSAGFADARAPGYSRAQFYESASDEDVDVAGASAKHTPMDNSILECFPVDPEGQPLDPSATQIYTIS